MEKNKGRVNKKTIKLVILLLIVVLIAMISIFIVLKLHSREYISSRLLKGIDNLNYTYVDEKYRTVQVLGKLEKVTADDGEIIYRDYENKTTIDAFSEDNYKEKSSNNGIEDMDYYKTVLKIIFDSHYTYQYNGTKEDNGQKYVIIDLQETSGKGTKMGVLVWINNSLNLVEKMEYYTVNDKDYKVYETIECSYHTNENTLTDVQVSEDINNKYSDDTNN